MKNSIKNKVILVILIFISIIALFNVKAYAETDSETETEAETTQWADFSNAEIEIIKNTSLNYASYNLSLKNVTCIDKHSYKVYISNSSTKPTEDDGLMINGVLNKCIDEYLEKAGDSIYLWIDEIYIEETKPLIEAYKIERPSQNPLGARISGSFKINYGDFISFYEPSKDVTNREVVVKIGEVTDIDILKQIQSGSSTALEDLLTYAKSAPSITTKTLKSGTTLTPSIISELDLTDKGYYYVYYEAVDENGTYYPVEDVSLYQYGYYSSNGGQLIDYLSDQFKWNLGEAEENVEIDDKSDTTVAQKILPNTGIRIFILSILVIILTMISSFLYLKYTKYRGIK